MLANGRRDAGYQFMAHDPSQPTAHTLMVKILDGAVSPLEPAKYTAATTAGHAGQAGPFAAVRYVRAGAPSVRRVLDPRRLSPGSERTDPAPVTSRSR
jgi:hypothetical protein